MEWFQTLSLVFGLPALAMGIHELTHLAVARLVSPFSIERVSWIPFQLRLDFDQMPSKATLRMIALAPLLVGSVAAVIAIQTGVWQQLQSVGPYYLYYLVWLNWLLYIAPSLADLRLALWPQIENLSDIQTNPR